MEFVTGVRKKETLELSKVLAPQSLDQEVLTDGSIYSIRNMGEIAFVILRKRDGLLQTVWEEGKTNLSISELKEGDCIRVKGTVRAEERAPHGQRGAQHGAVRHAFAGRRGDHAPDAAGGRSDGYKHSGVILFLAHASVLHQSLPPVGGRWLRTQRADG